MINMNFDEILVWYYKMYLFSLGNIKDNIRLNNKNISDEEIVEISKYVNAQ